MNSSCFFRRVFVVFPLLMGAGSLTAACQGEGARGLSHSASGSGQMDQPVSTPNPGPDTGRDPAASVDDPAVPSDPALSDQVPGVHGQVVDARNRPVANAFVAVSPLGNSPAVPELAVFSDAEGQFIWPLQPGRYRVSVRHERGQAEADIDLTSMRRVTLTLRLR